jgi:DNA replication and repair protein RecF
MDGTGGEGGADTRLWCARLTLSDFRNHASTTLTVDARPVCLFGPNGAGKTNILEALTTLAPGRGLRGASAADLASAGGAQGRERLWTVAAAFQVDGESTQLGVGMERGPDGAAKRVARVDGRPASASDLAAAARMLWVTPAMDRLFTGPAGDRRRFFDRLVMARVASHGSAAARYERATRERQKLLNDAVFDDAWLGGLEEAMALSGAAMALARAATLGALQTMIAGSPEGAFPKALLAIEGAMEQAAAEGADQDRLTQLALQRLRDGRARDAAAGRAGFGPHRSDLLVRHAPKDMLAELCSTGEQKALLIGLILAQARALAAEPRAGPALVLIDEAGAHLDADRRAALYEELLRLPGQSWLTGTEAMLFEAFGARAQRVAVQDGAVFG